MTVDNINASSFVYVYDIEECDLCLCRSASLYVAGSELWSALGDAVGKSVVMVAQAMQPLQLSPKYLPLESLNGIQVVYMPASQMNRVCVGHIHMHIDSIA